MDSSSKRKANQEDFPLITKALAEFLPKFEAYPWVTSVNWNKVLAVFEAFIKSGDAYIVGGYLVLAAPASTWYSDDLMLQEICVFRIASGGTRKDVVSAIGEIAKEQGCIVISTGDTSDKGLMAEAYKSGGFSELPPIFFRRL